jgi:adhesin transport system outer membrane protein
LFIISFSFRIIHFSIFTVFGMFWMAGGAVAAPFLDLHTMAEIVTSTNPQVYAAIAEKEAAQEELSASKMARYPDISLQTQMDSFKTLGMTLVVEQPLWTAGRLAAQVDGAAFNLDQAQHKIHEVQYLLVVRLLDYWQQLIAAREKVSASEGVLNKLNELQAMMERRVASGVSPLIDLKQVMARLALIRVEHDDAKSQEKIAIARIQQISNGQLTPGWLLNVPVLKQQGVIANQFDLGVVMSLFESAVQAHPTVKKALANIEEQSQVVIVSRAAQWPEMYAQLRQDVASGGGGSSSGGLVGFRYAPGQGFSSYASTKAAQARVKSARQALESARRDVMESLGDDYESLRRSKTRVEAFSASLEGTKAVLASYERQFVMGHRTWLEVLNTVREVYQNLSSLINSQAEMVVITYRLKMRLGLLGWNYVDKASNE